jgi:hypothetical protein
MNQPYRERAAPDATAPLEEKRVSIGAFASRHRVPLPKKALAFAAALLLGCAALDWSVTGGLRCDQGSILPIALLFVLFVLAIVFALTGLEPRIDLHDGGLVVRRLFRSVELPFEDVDRIYYHPAVTRLWPRRIWGAEMFLVALDGRAARIPANVGGNVELARTIDRQCVRPLLADARKALAEGEMLRFGPIVLDQGGIRIRDRVLAWSEVDRVETNQHELCFYRVGHSSFSGRSSYFVVPLGKIPHARLLVSLLAGRAKVVSDHPFWTRWLS